MISKSLLLREARADPLIVDVVDKSAHPLADNPISIICPVFKDGRQAETEKRGYQIEYQIETVIFVVIIFREELCVNIYINIYNTEAGPERTFLVLLR